MSEHFTVGMSFNRPESATDNFLYIEADTNKRYRFFESKGGWILLENLNEVVSPGVINNLNEVVSPPENIEKDYETW